MSPELSHRLAEACARGNPTPAQRMRLIAAADPPGVRTFADLPADVRQLVLDLEAVTPNR